MRSNIETKNKLTLVSELGNESKFQILKYNELSGINKVDSLSAIKAIENSGQRLKQVRILLNESAVKIQNNKLSYMLTYHLPLRGLLLPEGGEFEVTTDFLVRLYVCRIMSLYQGDSVIILLLFFRVVN